MGGLRCSVEIPHGEHADLKADPWAPAFMCATAMGICLCVLEYKRGRGGSTKPASAELLRKTWQDLSFADQIL